MSLEVRNFQRGDLGKFESKHPVKADRDAYYYEGMEQLSWTMLEDGKPIAAWGMQVHEPGVATAWADFSHRSMDLYPLAIAKNMKRKLGLLIEELSLHRVQAMIAAGDTVSIEWIEWLGFHYVGPIEQDMEYFDILLYARLID